MKAVRQTTVRMPLKRPSTIVNVLGLAEMALCRKRPFPQFLPFRQTVSTSRLARGRWVLEYDLTGYHDKLLKSNTYTDLVPSASLDRLPQGSEEVNNNGLKPDGTQSHGQPAPPIDD